MTQSRRDFMRRVALASGAAYCPWLPVLAAQSLAQVPGSTSPRNVILLWMTGGPSQTDTFDMKPGHAHGGEFKEISTVAPGLRFCEHLPGLAAMADRLAVVRSLTTKEGDHARGTYLVHTGQRPGGPLRYPAIGASMAKALTDAESDLPQYVSVLPALQLNPDAFGPGFLGPRYAPAVVQRVGSVGDANSATPANNPSTTAGGALEPLVELGMQNLAPASGLAVGRIDRRSYFWNQIQANLLDQKSHPAAIAHDTVYRKAFQLANSRQVEAFDLTREPMALREAYGRGAFGQGCLIARRLVEQGVRFVEVSLGSDSLGWDTHVQNFPTLRKLCGELDRGWSQLMRDLLDRGLLESTTILWIGEFGRTPKINENAGRDHFPGAWSCVLAGAGIRGGQAFGATTADGTEVADRPVQIADVLATLCRAAGVDPAVENLTGLGRPVKISDGQPIGELLS